MKSPTADDLLELGYRVVLTGNLKQLRDFVGLTRNAQANLIGVEAESLRRWEEKRQAMNLDTAERIGEWYWGAEQALDSAGDLNFDILMSAARAAQHMGIPFAEIESAIVANGIKHERLGVLGLFLYRSSMKATA
ncbi:MAG: helix-turn-helix domain-containing protein [Nitrospiraceae bacterium]